MPDQPEDATSSEAIAWSTFLQEVAPGSERRVTQVFVPRPTPRTAVVGSEGKRAAPSVLSRPELTLPCDICNGARKFVSDEMSSIGTYYFISYVCRNCVRNTKMIAVLLRHKPEVEATEERHGYFTVATKLGEFPPFGERFSRRVLNLVGDDARLLLTGRQAENQGMGLGAFVYYRRVVTRRKDLIIDKMIEMAVTLGAKPEVVAALERAKGETQFARGLEAVELPDALKYKGESLIGILYRALSVGIHRLSDEECLSYATATRQILEAIAERIAQVQHDEVQLGSAIGKLSRIAPAESKQKGGADSEV